MKLKRIVLLVLLSMFSIFNSLFAQDSNHNFKEVRKIAKKLVRKKKVPGIAISIVKDGEFVYSEGFGYANRKDKVKVFPDSTIFRVGSVSKPIAAVGLAKLVASGKMDLDASIYDYVPYFPKKTNDFSIRQLGGHMAGIRNYKGNEFMNKEPLTIREGVQLFENDSLLFEPGKDYLYTSYNWNLVSLAMQEVLQKGFEAYIKDEVLVPIGMKLTHADRNQVIPNKAKFYRKRKLGGFKEAERVHNYFKLAGGGYLSTSEDIALFGNALLDEQLVSHDVLNEFTTSQKIDEKLTYYGIGFQASFDHKGRPYYGHVGNGLGGYAIFYVYPEEKVVVSILMNCSNPNQDERFNAIIDAVFSQFKKK